MFISKYPDQKAVVVDTNTVSQGYQEMSFNAWAKKVTGWSAVNIYEWIELSGTGKTLDVLRREHLEKEAEQSASMGSETPDK